MLNGNKTGDERGEWTYMSKRGSFIIDYAIVNQDAWEETKTFKIGERVDTDHQLLEIEITRKSAQNEKVKRGKRGVAIWTEETLKKFNEKEGSVRVEGDSVEERWSLKKACKNCITWRRIKKKQRKSWERRGKD